MAQERSPVNLLSLEKDIVERLDVIKKLRYIPFMIKPDRDLVPDWDEYNINHIAEHGLRPEQVEEVYYGEGPLPTVAVKQKKKRGKSSEYKYRLWSTDASGTCIEVIVAPYPEYRLWRCVTAFPMSNTIKKAYYERVRK